MRYVVLSFLCMLIPGAMGCSETGGVPGVCEAHDECNDGNACTDDYCQGLVDEEEGVCANVPHECPDDLSDCTAATCDPAIGCEPVADGTPCHGGTCQAGMCELESTVLPCTEQGVRNAIAAGGGPYMFACDGPTTLAASFGIERDVILDAEDQLTVDGFAVSQGVTAELHGFRMRPQEGAGPEDRASTHNSGTLLIANSSISGFAGGIVNQGTLMVRESILSGNPGGGIGNLGTLTLTDSEISGNGTGGFGLAANDGAGIHNDHGIVTVANSTLSANLSNGTGGGIYNKGGSVTLTNCTLSGNEASNGAAVFNTGVLTLTRTTVADNTAFEGSSIHNVGVATATNTIIEGDCGGMTALASGNHNIESPADTCGLPGRDDQSGVTAEALNLGPLADNGGPTLTHKPGDGGLGEGSFAIDAIPEKDCAVDTDQRGEPRPETGGTMCDVGAVEVQP